MTASSTFLLRQISEPLTAKLRRHAAFLAALQGAAAPPRYLVSNVRTTAYAVAGPEMLI
jgi:hypothetical protein